MHKWITKDISISIRKEEKAAQIQIITMPPWNLMWVQDSILVCIIFPTGKTSTEDFRRRHSKKRKEIKNHLALGPTALTENPDLKKAFPSTTGGREPTVLASSRDGRDAASRWGESKESKNKDGRRVNQYTSEISLIQETWTDSVYNLCWTCTTILNSHHLWQLFCRSCQKTTRWSLLRVYNSFQGAFWDRFAAVNCSKVKPFIEHNQKKCCNLWSCITSANHESSWIHGPSRRRSTSSMSAKRLGKEGLWTDLPLASMEPQVCIYQGSMLLPIHSWASKLKCKVQSTKISVRARSGKWVQTLKPSGISASAALQVKAMLGCSGINSHRIVPSAWQC